jgi:hypothetical protein
MEEETSLNGVPLFSENNEMQAGCVIEFETALMALDFAPKNQFPCPRRTLNFGPKKTIGKQQNNLTHQYATMKRIMVSDFDTKSKVRLQSATTVGQISGPTAASSKKV